MAEELVARGASLKTKVAFALEVPHQLLSGRELLDVRL